LRLIAGGWFVLREKYCWLVADKPSEQAVATMILRATGNEKYSGIPFNPMGKFVAAAHACLIFVPTSVQLIRQSTLVHMQAVNFNWSCKIM
jgi:hypothetical protein